jgi:hypothetical protein
MTPERPIQDMLPPGSPVTAPAPRRRRERSRRGAGARVRNPLGLMPLIAVLTMGGLLMISSADTAARLEEPGSEAVFWIGLMVIYLPIVLRLAGAGARYSERMALVILLGLALYLVKVVHSPSGFTLHDELASWRGVWDLLDSGRLFGENPIVRGYRVFPGMTAVTGAIVQMSGLPVFQAALILIGLARVTLMAALFMILTRAGDSRVAGFAIAVYVCNPSMLYFDSQFGYESLGLAIAGGYLLMVTRGAQNDPLARHRTRSGILAALLLTGAALIVSHHLTTYAIVGFLALWSAMLAVIAREPLRTQLLEPAATRVRPRAGALTARLRVGPALGFLTLAAGAACWFALVAGGATQDELGSVFTEAAEALFHLVFGGGETKTLFQAGTGKVDPLVVRALGFASVGLLAVGIPLGIWRIWKSYRQRPLAVSLGIVALLYPFTLVPRLTQAGSEISQRASEFVFAGIGFAVAVFFTALCERVSPGRARLYAVIATILAGLVFVGGVILGESPASRQPGRFAVGAEGRSISPQGEAAAGFAAGHLPPDSRVLVDGPNGLLLGSYGHMEPVIGEIDEIPVPEVFFHKRFDAIVRKVIAHDAIDYVVVDRRLSHSLPIDGYYYDREEPRAHQLTDPISGRSLRKFNEVNGIYRIYDNGPIVIYDTTRIRPPT